MADMNNNNEYPPSRNIFPSELTSQMYVLFIR